MIEIKVSTDRTEIASAVSTNISATLTRLQGAAAMLATNPASVAAVLCAKEQTAPPATADAPDRLRHLAGSEALAVIIDLISAATAGLHVTILVNVRPETTNPGE